MSVPYSLSCVPGCRRNCDGFLDLLPAVTAQIRHAFRHLRSERREEAVQGSVADAYAAYVGLCEQGRRAIAYASPLARYAVRRFRAGRLLGMRLNTFDVSSPYRRAGHDCQIESLGNCREHDWREAAVEDRRCGPAETAALRVDFAQWLRQLPTGESTAAAARRLSVSSGRISQYRRELEASWRRFQKG